MMIQFEILGCPITKKNSSRIFINRKTNKPFIMPSQKYKEYAAACGQFIPLAARKKIDYPVNVRCIYYMPTKRRVDLTNLLEATHDILVDYGVLADDNSGIVASVDGSRVLYDKDNPRVEIQIKRMG